MGSLDILQHREPSVQIFMDGRMHRYEIPTEDGQTISASDFYTRRNGVLRIDSNLSIAVNSRCARNCALICESARDAWKDQLSPPPYRRCTAQEMVHQALLSREVRSTELANGAEHHVAYFGAGDAGDAVEEVCETARVLEKLKNPQVSSLVFSTTGSKKLVQQLTKTQVSGNLRPGFLTMQNSGVFTPDLVPQMAKRAEMAPLCDAFAEASQSPVKYTLLLAKGMYDDATIHEAADFALESPQTRCIKVVSVDEPVDQRIQPVPNDELGRVAGILRSRGVQHVSVFLPDKGAVGVNCGHNPLTSDVDRAPIRVKIHDML